MLTTIFLIACGLSLIALIAIVLYSNPRAAINRWLSVFMFAGLLWLLANLFANLFVDEPDTYLLFSRLALVGPALLPSSFLLFCLAYTNKPTSFLQRVLLFLPSAILLVLVPTKYNVEALGSDSVTLITGAASPLLIITLLVYFSVGTILLVRLYRHADQLVRQQLSYMLIGFILTAVPGIILSAVLPILGNSTAATYGPAVIISFALFTSIAIIRHRLFDIRFYVVRALAYSVTLIVLGVIYVAPAVYLIAWLIGASFTTSSFIITIIAASILATNYYHVRRWFNQLSSKLFFRDAYEVTDVLGRLNEALSSTISIDDMTRSALRILSDGLRPEYLGFLIATDGGDFRVKGPDTGLLKRELRDGIAEHVSKLKEPITDVGLLSDLNATKHYFTQARVAIVVRLSMKQEGKKDVLGYIVLGNRKSGMSYSPNDIKMLSAASNTLAIAMQNALRFEEIQQFNQTLQQKVDEATRKLRNSNEKLRKLDETKDEFISMASHQLRTPLTSVKGYLSMVLEGDVGPLKPQQAELLKQSFLSSERMVNLIADLLNLSRLNTGKFVIDAVPTDLRTVVEAELAQLTEVAKAKDIELSYHHPENLTTLLLDENKIHQVVMNFIDNAIYYTPPGGKISVELSETPTSVEYRVVDTGIGVPKALQHRLFTKFYRADNARQNAPRRYRARHFHGQKDYYRPRRQYHI